MHGMGRWERGPGGVRDRGRRREGGRYGWIADRGVGRRGVGSGGRGRQRWGGVKKRMSGRGSGVMRGGRARARIWTAELGSGSEGSMGKDGRKRRDQWGGEGGMTVLPF